MRSSRKLADDPTSAPDDGGTPVLAAARNRGRAGMKRTAGVAVAAAVVLAFAGACGDDDESPTATATAPAASTSEPTAEPTTAPYSPTTDAPATGTATTVTVSETEFAIELSQDTFTPGTYTFVTNNDGGATHALEIEGPGLDEASTADLGPGQSEDLTVTLGPGTYKLYCPVGNHEGQGMVLEITVA